MDSKLVSAGGSHEIGSLPRISLSRLKKIKYPGRVYG